MPMLFAYPKTKGVKEGMPKIEEKQKVVQELQQKIEDA